MKKFIEEKEVGTEGEKLNKNLVAWVNTWLGVVSSGLKDPALFDFASSRLNNIYEYPQYEEKLKLYQFAVEHFEATVGKEENSLEKLKKMNDYTGEKMLQLIEQIFLRYNRRKAREHGRILFEDNLTEALSAYEKLNNYLLKNWKGSLMETLKSVAPWTFFDDFHSNMFPTETNITVRSKALAYPSALEWGDFGADHGIADSTNKESAHGLAQVPVGKGAITKNSVEIWSEGFVDCIGVFVQGDQYKALTHMTPDVGIYSLGYRSEEAKNYVADRISAVLSAHGENLKEARAIILCNAHVYKEPDFYKHVQEVAEKLREKGIQKVSIVHLPTAYTLLLSSSEHPNRLFAAGKRSNVDEYDIGGHHEIDQYWIHTDGSEIECDEKLRPVIDFLNPNSQDH